MRNSITINSDSISLQITVVFFMENNVRIAYCPSLDLSGYGKSWATAKEDFEYILKDYLQDQIKNNSLLLDLRQHNWN